MCVSIGGEFENDRDHSDGDCEHGSCDFRGGGRGFRVGRFGTAAQPRENGEQKSDAEKDEGEGQLVHMTIVAAEKRAVTQKEHATGNSSRVPRLEQVLVKTNESVVLLVGKHVSRSGR